MSHASRRHLLMLNPYGGGAHHQVAIGWQRSSLHHIDLFELPAHHWKWRMRTAAYEFCRRLEDELSDTDYDAVIVSSMLNLCELRGFLCAGSEKLRKLSILPFLIYFHENQLGYTGPLSDSRDVHFALTQLISTLSASAIGWNSRFNRDEFISLARTLLKKMPDRALEPALLKLENDSSILYPGIEIGFLEAEEQKVSPTLRVLFASRWEADKCPDVAASIFIRCIEAGLDIDIDFLGGELGAKSTVAELGSLLERLAPQLNRVGWQEADQYRLALSEADVFLSTAQHEYYGLAAAEAWLAGALLILPRKLAYPEVFDGYALFYDAVEEIPALLQKVAEAKRESLKLRQELPAAQRDTRVVERLELRSELCSLFEIGSVTWMDKEATHGKQFLWSHRAKSWDEWVEKSIEAQRFKEA